VRQVTQQARLSDGWPMGQGNVEKSAVGFNSQAARSDKLHRRATGQIVACIAAAHPRYEQHRTHVAHGNKPGRLRYGDGRMADVFDTELAVERTRGGFLVSDQPDPEKHKGRLESKQCSRVAASKGQQVSTEQATAADNDEINRVVDLFKPILQRPARLVRVPDVGRFEISSHVIAFQRAQQRLARNGVAEVVLLVEAELKDFRHGQYVPSTMTRSNR